MNKNITQLFYQDLLTLNITDLRTLAKHLRLSSTGQLGSKGAQLLSGTTKKELAAVIAKYQSTMLRKKASLKSADQLNTELIDAIQNGNIQMVKKLVAEGADPLNNNVRNALQMTDNKMITDYLTPFTINCQNEYDLIGETISDSKIAGNVIVYNVPGTNNHYCFTLEDLYGLVSSSNPVNPYTGERFSQQFINMINTEIIPSEAYAKVVEQMKAEQTVATSKITSDLVVLNRVMEEYPYLDITGIQNGRQDPNLLKTMRDALKEYADISDEATYDEIMTALGGLEAGSALSDWGFKVTQYLLDGPQVLLEMLTDEVTDPFATLMMASAIPTEVLMTSLNTIFQHSVRSFPTIPPSFVSNEYITTLMSHLQQLRDEEDIRTDLYTLTSLIQNRNWTEAQGILKSIFEKLINDHNTEIRGDILNVLKNFFIQWDATDPFIFSELYNLAFYQNADQIAETIDNIRTNRYNPRMWYEDENGIFHRNTISPEDNQKLLASELLEKLLLGNPIRELMEYSKRSTSELANALQDLLLEQVATVNESILAKIDSNFISNELINDAELYQNVQAYATAMEENRLTDAISELKKLITTMIKDRSIDDSSKVLYYLADILIDWSGDDETSILQNLINSMTGEEIAITLDNITNHRRDERMWYTDAQGITHRRTTEYEEIPAEYPVTPRLSISDSQTESESTEDEDIPSNVQRRLF